MSQIFGTPGNRQQEIINGSPGDDEIYPLGGWDLVRGGAGTDTVFVSGRAGDFRVHTEEGITYVDALSGASAGTESAQLVDVEYVKFSDGTVIDLTLPRVFEARAGMDNFVGSTGIDRVIFPSAASDYRIERAGDSIFVTDLGGSGGTDRLRGIERLEFSDGKLALDLDGHARDVARLVGALLGSEAINGGESSRIVTGIVLSLRDKGEPPAALAALALAALSLTDEQFLRLLFQNVAGRLPSADESQALMPLFDNSTQSALLTQVMDTGLVDAAIGLAGLSEVGLWYA